MHRAYARFCSFLLAFLLCACGSQSPSSGGEDAAGQDIPSDLPSTLDAPLPDAPGVLDDAGSVVQSDRLVPDDGQQPPGCTDDAACIGDPGGPVCDTQARRCVPCTPANDRCLPGQYCVAEMNRCAPGCRDDVSCAQGGGQHCDLTMRRCVQCATDDHCEAGTLCVGSLCVPGCTPSQACPAGQSCCGGGCVDISSNIAHCGACGTACRYEHAEGTCTSGRCALGACAPGYANCDGNPANGCEASSATDADNCGACGNSCPAVTNGRRVCAGGVCGSECLAGFHRCGGACVSNTDLATCGASCTPCPTSSNGRASCNGVSCSIQCDAGFHLCGGRCVSSSDPNTCGDRCDPCPPGPVGSTTVCTQDRVCGFECATGSHRCDTTCRLNTSVQGCGTSCTPCPVAANTSATCSGTPLVCGTTCRAGFADCDGDLGNGCEVPLQTVSDCERCGDRCAPGGPHTVGVCAVTSSRVGCSFGCENGWRDCDNNIENGCEVTGSCTVERELFYDGFESGDGRWTRDSVWTFGRGSFYSPCSGEREIIAERSVFDPCIVSGNATLITPIDISRATSLNLTHRSRSIRGSRSSFTIYVSIDNGRSWINGGNHGTTTCGLQGIPLSDFVGHSTMLLRFSFYSGACESAFWRLDEVRLQATVRNY